jgi:subtilisin family serine protease
MTTMRTFPNTIERSSGAQLRIDSNRLVLAFRNAIQRSDLDSFLSGQRLQLEEHGEGAASPGGQGDGQGAVRERVNHRGGLVWVHASEPIDGARCNAIEEAAKAPHLGLKWISRVYQSPGTPGRRGLCAPVPDSIFVKGSGMNAARVKRIAASAASDLPSPDLHDKDERFQDLDGYRHVEIKNPGAIHALDLVERLSTKGRSAGVEDVLFDTVPMLVPSGGIPNDPYYGDQWNLVEIHAGPSDSGACAWDISTGSGAVIGIFDDGCDLNHPDLFNRYVRSGDRIGINVGDMTSDGSPVPDVFGDIPAHGTCTAGVAAASYNNALGVAGVAGNAGIVPIAFMWWTESELARGVKWAAKQGIKIINLGFGIPRDMVETRLPERAMKLAFQKGVLMCAPTLNDNRRQIAFPACSEYVMAVGAIDRTEHRRHDELGSNYGPELAVVAPGESIVTTDILGPAGYSSDDYLRGWGYTSGAVAHVTGLAALIQSRNPGLDNVQIRDIIQRTAAKIGDYTYVPNGSPLYTWNEEVGYGLINALAALQAVPAPKSGHQGAGSTP